MKKTLLMGAFVLLSFNFSLNSKSIMPGLDRMKEKVNNIVDNAPKISFKEYLSQQQKDKAGSVYFNGIARTDESVQNLEKSIQGLYWCKQREFIDKLASLLNQRDQALIILKDEINKKYASLKNPVLSFAKDVLKEKSDIEVLISDTMKSMQALKENEQTKIKIKELFNQLIVYNGTISNLMDVVDKLLIS